MCPVLPLARQSTFGRYLRMSRDKSEIIFPTSRYNISHFNLKCSPVLCAPLSSPVKGGFTPTLTTLYEARSDVQQPLLQSPSSQWILNGNPKRLRILLRAALPLNPPLLLASTLAMKGRTGHCVVRSTALSRRRILRGKTCRECCPKVAIFPGNDEEAHDRGVRRTQSNLGHDFVESATTFSQPRPLKLMI